jgi:hypothetical protein
VDLPPVPRFLHDRRLCRNHGRAWGDRFAARPAVHALRVQLRRAPAHGLGALGLAEKTAAEHRALPRSRSPRRPPRRG